MFDAYHRMNPNVAMGGVEIPPRSQLGLYRSYLMRSGNHDPARQYQVAPPHGATHPRLPFINSANPGTRYYNL